MNLVLTVVEENKDGELVIRQLVEDTPEARQIRRVRVWRILRRGRVPESVADLSNCQVGTI